MNAAGDEKYIGGELEVFAHAINWKNYWISFLADYLSGEILEVGAGIGTNTRLLSRFRAKRWVCLEPDSHLLTQAEQVVKHLPEPARYVTVLGTVAELAVKDKFDTIIYIDVLEHIENDKAELAQAAAHLKPKGRLVVLSPAHSWLFSNFDAAIGHYRRYRKKSLVSAAPPGLAIERLCYLDCCGLLASLANRMLLRQDLPTTRQILFWDRIIVPCSRFLDPLLLYKLGKSVLAVWQLGGCEKKS